MKADAMAKGVRVTLTAAEARFVALALENNGTPAVAPIAAGIRRAIAMVDAKSANARAKRAADRERRRAEPKFQHFEVDGYRVSATQGDWYDASRDVDTRHWQRIREAEPWQILPDQTEHRPGWWMIYVWAPDAVAVAIGEELIERLTDLPDAARRIVATHAE